MIFLRSEASGVVVKEAALGEPIAKLCSGLVLNRAPPCGACCGDVTTGVIDQVNPLTRQTEVILDRFEFTPWVVYRR